MNHNCHSHFERTGSTEIMSTTLVRSGECTACHRPLNEVYDYPGTMDDETDEWVHHVLSHTARDLHDLLSRVISRGRAGEWREAVDAKHELDDTLQALVAKE